ncbi:MAG: MATE family efflux transporter [Chloroflexia bacterium]|nr:MATE family efflux transporter [Chloroflexia bacterium]MDQ3613643.1 MATE family efflux transporter [Chloroflexota bacterium]
MSEPTVIPETIPTDSQDAPPEMSQRRVLKLAVPIIGENLLQTSVGVVDTLFVAALGSAALAGIGVALEIVFFAIAILSSIAIGGTVLVSQAIGARSQEEANRLARQTVIWGLLLSIPLAVVSYVLAPPLVGLFRTEPDVAVEAVTYLRITGATIITLLMTFVCGAVLRGAGDGQTPLRASIVANVINVFLAYAMIFGEFGFPRLEVAGSAWSTTISRAVAAGILLWFLFSGRRAISLRGRNGWLPRPRTASSLMKLGVPAAIEQMLMSAGFTTMVAIVAVLGTNALAAQQISFTALSLAFLPGFGFATAATALVGQSLGARDLDAARFAARVSARWSLIWMTIGGLIYFVLSESILGIFTDDPAVIDQGTGALRTLALGLPFWAFWTVFGGSLRGLGDARTPMIASVSSMWLAVGLAWIGVNWFDQSLTFVWATFLLTTPIAAVINTRSFARRLETTRENLRAGIPPPTPA